MCWQLRGVVACGNKKATACWVALLVFFRGATPSGVRPKDFSYAYDFRRGFVH
jgi:hypothetical protein